jgi:hypothetical protein
MTDSFSYNALMNRKGLLACFALAAVAAWTARFAIIARAETKTPGELGLERLLREIPEELRFQPKQVPDDQNAWTGLREAIAMAPKPTLRDGEFLQDALSETTLPTKKADLERLAAIFATYDASLEAAKGALARPECEIAEIEGLRGNVDSMRGPRRYSTILTRRASYRLAQGDWGGAVSDYRGALGLAERIAVSGGTMHHALISSSLLARTSREIRWAVFHPKMPKEGVRELSEALPAAERLDEGFRRSLKSELYWFVRNEVMRLDEPGSAGKTPLGSEEQARSLDSGWDRADAMAAHILQEHPHPFDPLDTVRSASAIYVEALANLDRPWKNQRDIEKMVYGLVRSWPPSRLLGGPAETPAAAEELARAKPGLWKEKNPYGRFAAWYHSAFSDQSSLTPFRTKADLGATRLILGVRLFELERGSLPQTVEQLVAAGILSQAPQDPFGEGSLRFDAASRKVWSVGPNGRDDGGIGSYAALVKTPDYVWTFGKTEATSPDERLAQAEEDRRRSANGPRGIGSGPGPGGGMPRRAAVP